ncbi:hypothetical protein H4219_004483 [Mycoemilia scoparia]|uniref:Uncharacterized protein n=1 Tax=Mycoemilia scoparia TaxID=417184 RepID=A0A9W7ZY54_9FUNG|nr:hypothetical protein H4219_004483 [Mycoemilia scoparia]
MIMSINSSFVSIYLLAAIFLATIILTANPVDASLDKRTPKKKSIKKIKGGSNKDDSSSISSALSSESGGAASALSIPQYPLVYGTVVAIAFSQLF